MDVICFSKASPATLERMTTSKHLRGAGITPSSTEFHPAPPVSPTARTTVVAAKVEQLKLRPGEWQVVRIGYGAHLATPFRRRGCEVRTVGRHDGMVDVWACWPTEPPPAPKKRAARKPKQATPESPGRKENNTDPYRGDYVQPSAAAPLTPEQARQRAFDQRDKARADRLAEAGPGGWVGPDRFGRSFDDDEWGLDLRYSTKPDLHGRPPSDPQFGSAQSPRPF